MMINVVKKNCIEKNYIDWSKEELEKHSFKNSLSLGKAINSKSFEITTNLSLPFNLTCTLSNKLGNGMTSYPVNCLEDVNGILMNTT